MAALYEGMEMKQLFRMTAYLSIAFLATSHPATAEPVKIKFTLDWKLQGLHAWFYWSKAKGYFAAENLDVIIDQGEGSAATVTRIMSGAYDAGFGDVNAIIQNAAAKPGQAPVMVYMIYNKAPFTLLMKADGPIKTIKDLEGTRLGSPAGGASNKLLPILAKKNGTDYSKIEITQIAPNLQEQILLQGQVDSVAVFSITSYFNLLSLKRDPDKDFRWLFYADYGLDLYSNGVMVSQQLARQRPEAVKGLLRAINRSLKETVANPDEAIAILEAEEPLIKKAIERKRLLYTYGKLIDVPETRENGIGGVMDSRLQSSIATIAEAFELPRKPAPEEVFNRAFLPSRSDRAPVEGAGE